MFEIKFKSRFERDFSCVGGFETMEDVKKYLNLEQPDMSEVKEIKKKKVKEVVS